MSRILVSLLAGLGLAATALAPASAQSIPPGSYQQSCQNIRVRGDQLTARCTNAQGTWIRSTLAIGSCRGDIGNSNGQLTCNNSGYGNGRWNNNGNGRYNNGRGHDRDHDNNNGNGGYNNGGYNNGGYNNGGYNNRGVPGGSYQSSCTNIQRNGSTLTATCTAPNGSNVTTSINTAQCRGGDIANVNGRLACR
jgi:hypothetical protein